jgi:hypothetical protein
LDQPAGCDVLAPAELEKVRRESGERLRDLPI